MKHILYFLALMLAVGMATGCRHAASEASEDVRTDSLTDSVAKPFSHAECNAIYYWKTVLKFDSASTEEFVNKHKIGRAYVRFFDVVPDKSPLATETLIPNATLRVEDSLPVGEIIPVIYITDEAIKEMKHREDVWAQKIVGRVENMYHYHNLGPLPEIQLDCDWTSTTAQTFFTLCEQVKARLEMRNINAAVSSTIRLHQLASEAPPVDYGVLMLYNTGSFRNPDTENSILSVDDVEPYLSKLSSYPLHLDFAYPIFGWNLVYRGKKSQPDFFGILRADISEIKSSVRKIADNKYIVTRDCAVGDKRLYVGDIIRHEESSVEAIKILKSLIDSKLGGGKPHSTILYHFDSKNLSNYSDDDLTSIYQ